MDSKFYRDSVFKGRTPGAIKLGSVMLLGRFWTYVEGCQLLYRGPGIEDVDFENILAAASIDAEQISVPDFLQHQDSASYFYVVRRVNNCGDEEKTIFATAKMLLDENGDLTGPYCNRIFDAKAEQIEEEKIKLIWSYWPISQQAQVSEFLIYYDSGSGTIDYENPLAEIEYSRPGIYSFEIGSLSGESYLFCIKTATADGLERVGSREIKVQIDNVNVPSIEILQVQTL